MTDWLDTAHATVQYLRYASSTLADMARKLDYCIPNSPAVPELFAIAHTLDRKADDLSQSTGEKVAEDCRQAQENTALILQAALAGKIGGGAER